MITIEELCTNFYNIVRINDVVQIDYLRPHYEQYGMKWSSLIDVMEAADILARNDEVYFAIQDEQHTRFGLIDEPLVDDIIYDFAYLVFTKQIDADAFENILFM